MDIENIIATEINLERIEKTMQILLEDYYIQPEKYDSQTITRMASYYEKMYIHLENLQQAIGGIRKDLQEELNMELREEEGA